MTLANDNLPRTPEAYLNGTSGSADIAMATRSRSKADAFQPLEEQAYSGPWAHPVRKLKPRTYGTPLFRWTMTVVVWALVVTVIVQVAG